MMQKHNSLVVPALLAVALVATACQDDARQLTSVAHKPNFWQGPSPVCLAGKWTGGGRIDPPGNADLEDETSGGQPPRYSDGLPPMNGKVTFGFNVFLAVDDQGNCFVEKGEIQVNHHPAQVAWHVSIHHGVDDFDGATVFAAVFPDNSGRGFCVVVGLPESFMTARVNGDRGFEKVQFEGCDNDRGEPQNSRTDAMRWRAVDGSASGDAGDTGLTYLTGGNIVEHGS